MFKWWHQRGEDKLAADLGIKLIDGPRVNPAEEDEVPPVAIGPSGYETDEAGEPVELACEGILRGIGAMRMQSAAAGVVHAELMKQGDNLANIELLQRVFNAIHRLDYKLVADRSLASMQNAD